MLEVVGWDGVGAVMREARSADNVVGVDGGCFRDDTDAGGFSAGTEDCLEEVDWLMERLFASPKAALLEKKLRLWWDTSREGSAAGRSVSNARRDLCSRKEYMIWGSIGAGRDENS